MDAVRRIAALPGVQSAAGVSALPMYPVGIDFALPFTIDGKAAPANGEEPRADIRMATPGYFETMKIALRNGRTIDERDLPGMPGAMVINETMARRYFGGENPLGRVVRNPHGRAEVVGVVGDVKHYGLDAEVTPDIYSPIPQVPDVTVQWLNNNMYWGLRTTGDPGALRDPFRRALREVDADVPAAALRTMDEALELALAPRRLNLWLVRVFAILALLLAGAGVYAVTAFSVALRRREIAIRAALGARPDQNVRTVVGDAVGPIVLGLAIGAAGALIAAPALRSVLFEVEPVAAGPFSLVAATLLAAVAVGADSVVTEIVFELALTSGAFAARTRT
jgi:putative ABC transport system permease protein